MKGGRCRHQHFQIFSFVFCTDTSRVFIFKKILLAPSENVLFFDCFRLSRKNKTETNFCLFYFLRIIIYEISFSSYNNKKSSICCCNKFRPNGTANMRGAASTQLTVSSQSIRKKADDGWCFFGVLYSRTQPSGRGRILFKRREEKEMENHRSKLGCTDGDCQKIKDF